ncbi:ABC transporter permease [Acidimangrovimonas pyrenivorans]|uniref:ABC transporter permease n=1 Tax=Acidimangrovimonas pyrenivorans TaxID=2030798 RepID=A0ABV7AHL3_9RHOB
MDALTRLFEPGHALGLLAWSPPDGWGQVFAIGLLHSMEVAVGAYALGLVIGIIGAFSKLYGGEILRDLFSVYTTVVRAVPELVEILILFYLVPQLINSILLSMGYDRITLPPLLVGIIVLGVVVGAYMTEVLRGAILAVPHGQIEAARAYGMPPVMIARRITFPQMMANAIPGMANLWLNATKDTALLAVIGFNELTLTTLQAAGTTKSYFLFFIAAGTLYMIISILSGRFFAALERWARKGQPAVGRGGAI